MERTLIDDMQDYEHKRNTLPCSDDEVLMQVILGVAATQSKTLFWGYLGYKTFNNFVKKEGAAKLLSDTGVFLTANCLASIALEDFKGRSVHKNEDNGDLLEE
jgi:hypothetical protein